MVAAEAARVGSSASAPAFLPGLYVPPSYIPPLGSSFVPTLASLSTFNYAPLPVSVAMQQYSAA